MRIKTTTTFLHGESRYKENTEHNVGDEEGRYFVNNGWATSDEYAGIVGNQDVVKDIVVEAGSHNTTGEVG
jgi:hypothetical protein